MMQAIGCIFFRDQMKKSKIVDCFTGFFSSDAPHSEVFGNIYEDGF
jgi:hypothetical protein